MQHPKHIFLFLVFYCVILSISQLLLVQMKMQVVRSGCMSHRKGRGGGGACAWLRFQFSLNEDWFSDCLSATRFLFTVSTLGVSQNPKFLNLVSN